MAREGAEGGRQEVIGGGTEPNRMIQELDITLISSIFPTTFEKVKPTTVAAGSWKRGM